MQNRETSCLVVVAADFAGSRIVSASVSAAKQGNAMQCNSVDFAVSTEPKLMPWQSRQSNDGHISRNTVKKRMGVGGMEGISNHT